MNNCPVYSRPLLPGSTFRDLFPEGAVNTLVGKYQAININHLRDAIKSNDPRLLRETLAGVIYHYCAAHERNQRLSDDAVDRLDYIAQLLAQIDALEDQVEALNARLEILNGEPDGNIYRQNQAQPVPAA